jgi:hypothetical protein
MNTRWKPMIVAIAVLAGCEATAVRGPSGPRLLTAVEMDYVSAGSAVAISNGESIALGTAPQTMAVTSTLAISGGNPTPPPAVFR